MPDLTLGGLIDETLDHLYRAVERPWQTTVGSDGLANDADTQLTLGDGGSVETADLLEHGSEMLLVTAKSEDATPVFTVARGYLGTTKANAVTGDVVLKNPPFPRYQVARAVQRWVAGPANSHLPNITSAQVYRVEGKQYYELPSNTIQVFEVQHQNTLTGRIIDLAGWRMERHLPTAVVASGNLLRLPSVVSDDDPIIVKYQIPYAFSDATEAGTVTIPVGADDLPSLWAAAYLVSRREVSRLELDQIEEWAQEQAVARQGVNLRMVREMWGEYYRRLDEARDLHFVPRHRPFRKMPKVR